jgi:signal transduction histidine kinase
VTSLRRALIAIGAAGLFIGAVEIPMIMTSSFVDLRGLFLALTLLGGWGFIGAGLFVWTRRPDTRIGPLMVLAGFLFFVGQAGGSDLPLVFSIGSLLSNLSVAAIVHLLLSFPTGELRGRLDRLTVWTTWIVTAVGFVPIYLFSDITEGSYGCDECPRNVLMIADEGVGTPGLVVLNIFGVVVLAVVVAIVARRWKEATRPQRRVLGPVYFSGGFLLVMLWVSLASDLLGISEDAQSVAYLLGFTGFVLMPYLFLGALVRGRVLRGAAVSGLLTRLAETPGPGELRNALASALRDDSLVVAYWVRDEGRYVDSAGRRVELPGPGSGREVTRIERDGHFVAALIHHPLEEEDESLIEAVGAAASLALENERLDAELKARLEELTSSRTRIVEAGVAERRRLERNLHDGAQQRLVSLALNLRMARKKLSDDPETAGELLDASAKELDLALEELRELARGIHPAVLTDRGLDAALESLAGRAPVPVELHNDSDKLPEAVESAAYFVVSEALTNMAKYADATRATVQLERQNGFVLIAVSDDGVGGADPAAGSGLRGLGDRLSALDGRLEVDSAPGRGTTVRARIPCV